MATDLRSTPMSTLSRAASRSPLPIDLRPARAALSVELVDEDDAGLMSARFFEQFADAGGTDTRVHLDEVRAARGNERHLRFPGHRTREQRLASARRSNQQNA